MLDIYPIGEPQSAVRHWADWIGFQSEFDQTVMKCATRVVHRVFDVRRRQSNWLDVRVVGSRPHNRKVFAIQDLQVLRATEPNRPR